MKKLAIISEFNPFHNGHRYLLDKCKEITDADLFISFMSGDFVQRGEASILDKFSRAEVAVLNGFDLVIEMPSYISLQSAEYFAFKSIEILNKLDIDYLAFGIENIKSEDFKKYSYELIDKNEEVERLTAKYLKNKNSFTKSRSHAINEILGTDEFITSNNILALEYFRAISIINPNIEIFPITRRGSYNKDSYFTNSTFASSTAIRNNLSDSIKKYMPNVSYKSLVKFLRENNRRNDNIIYDIFRYKLLIENKPMENTLCFEQGMDKLFKKNILHSKNHDEFLSRSTSSRFTKSRIKRLVVNYILDQNLDLNKIDVKFIKVLAFNKNGAKLFSELKGKLSIVIRKSDADNMDNENLLVYQKMIDSSNLYSLITDRQFNTDYTNKTKTYE
ncbi:MULTISPECIES: nucleotidyltransferase family protein [Anaerococcus]|uniref:tRNA(Met) cytidine acetate ligase n=1 Tax=Anaerococcus prevotii ACS-065-V-Col13 TaxID=879305 RepID=F0GUL2_9FIRM|nr:MULTISPECIES: nucleotidyltransferase family protein [Anaerococcus]EGC82594.1 hypothetical protein HMPREF9290_1434 [Anaerococcus prevotii ACS-065-V-Col13]